MNYSISIISVGNWNKKIFNPIWVRNELFTELPEDERIQTGFDPINLALLYSIKGVDLTPKEDRIEIRVSEPEKNSIDLTNNLLNKIYSLLPHTPIFATGFNVNFKIDNDNINETQRKFILEDKEEDSFNLSRYTYVKESPEKYKTSIFVSKLQSEYQFGINFEYKGYTDFGPNILEEHISEAKSILGI